MSEYFCYLITFFSESNKTLIRVAFKTKEYVETEYFMEMEEREKIYLLLPEHIRSIGPIVEIEQIFDVIL